MSAVSISEISAESSSVAAISTNARIDYILRFNKQAILVVGENDYSSIGSLFLGNLPAEHNASYVAVSAKLNDIQIRCRIIEQLFADVLFDPEQALAVSILRLAKGSKQAISIVIDHAHLLSFQLIHELTYLAQVAKKAKLTINVVMLGNYAAGTKIAHEKSLFNNKIALVEASTGQLIKLDNKIFTATNKFSFTPKQRKVIFVFIILAVLLISLLFVLSQKTIINLGNFKTQGTEDINSALKPLVTKDQFVRVNTTTEAAVIEKQLAPEKIATQGEIYQALMQISPENNEKIAQPIDILNALEQANNEQITTKLESKTAINDTEKLVSQVDLFKYGINPRYYLAQPQGYVIQIAGVVNKTAFNNAVQRLNLKEYYGYNRLLNNNRLFILTSKIYPTWQQANTALAALTEKVRQQSPWIKPLPVVKAEILAYQKQLKDYN